MNLDEIKRKKTVLKPSTLAFLVKERQVLLAMKKRGFGVDKWNGVGGKIESGEIVEEAFLRELEEEIKVRALNHDRCAVLHFYDPFDVNNNFIVHVFVVSKWHGDPVETEEMRPEWFLHKQIPYPQMWPGDKYWLEYVLSGKKIEAHFLFDKAGDIKQFEIKELQ